ncbi:hypothetical protein EC968_001054 [Mortierella alpina]|nr:hypothetical protein EC968_001054 [Mortierella alpina]
MGAHWKREKVQDHKFDFINVDDFVDNSCWRQFRYLLVFAAIIRGILVYCSDIFTAVNLNVKSHNNTTFVELVDKDTGQVNLVGTKLPLDVLRWIFTGCIIFGFLLLALEMRRAKGIVASRDISYAFTSQIASRYYTVRSYPHYCLFAQIHNSKKTVDEVAFFCFFTFRNWKRLVLADLPRQVINAFILYQTFEPHSGELFQWGKIFKNDVYKMISIGAMIFTVVMCAMSVLMLVAAVILYIPLVSHIQGNLKEYCCHKIDKRIDELIRKNTKSRADAALSGKNKKDIAMSNLKQPTLPQLDLLEAGPPLPAQTPRNAYAQAQSPYPRNANVNGGQQGYGYSQAMYNNPTSQQSGYTQNYTKDEYRQGNSSQPDPAAFDPYAESAFTAEDVYDAYNSNQDQQHLQQKPRYDMYGDYYGGSNGGSQQRQAPATRTRRFDEYPSQQRSASPSQHGSDLDSNVNGSSGHGYSSNQGYGGNQGYGNEYYASSGQQAGSVIGYSSPPPRPRRNDTAQTRGTPRTGFM